MSVFVVVILVGVKGLFVVVTLAVGVKGLVEKSIRKRKKELP